MGENIELIGVGGIGFGFEGNFCCEFFELGLVLVVKIDGGVGGVDFEVVDLGVEFGDG